MVVRRLWYYYRLYSGQLRTTATTWLRVTKLLPLDNNGRGETFLATDLVCAAWAVAPATIMGMVADRHQLNIDGAVALPKWLKLIRAG